MSQSDQHSHPSAPDLSPRRRRLVFRATHRGTKETDLMVGGFVTRNIAAFSEAELDELEGVLELLDVDLADWLSGRRPIPPEVQARIFERFNRGSVGENVPGYGLGLNLARELARLHGGDLRLVASDESGTRFEVRLRRAA